MMTPVIAFFITLQIIATLLLAWSGFVAFFGLMKKKEPHGPGEPKQRFAVVICARNEEKVLCHLLNSLRDQDYPKDKWHVYLLADHCTDRTAEVARRYPFVTVYERFDGPQSGKGAVLAWGIAKILREKGDTFDAFLVFDADNIAKSDFMSRINEHLNKGNDVVQGNRLAGEPFRTFITQWYALYWPLYSFIYSYPREKLRLSCFLTGTGFAVKKSLLEAHGWSTHTITEDVEYAFQQCLRGSRAAFCVDAVCYDEQPSSFMVMMRQLARWCTGSYQIFASYFGKWCKAFFRRPSVRLVDNLALLLTGPCSIVIMICTVVVYVLFLSTFHYAWLFQIIMLALSYIASIFAAALTARYVGIRIRKVMPGIVTFPVFLQLYTLCSLYSLIFPQKRWKPIAHEGISEEDEDE